MTWLEQVQSHAERTWPDECVGALLSNGAVLELENVATAPARAFAVSARSLLEVERIAAVRGVEVRGFYHSHPERAAVPSREDLQFLTEGRVMVIVAVHEGRASDVREWALRDGRLVGHTP